MKLSKTTQGEPTNRFGGFFCASRRLFVARWLTLSAALLPLVACAEKHKPVPKPAIVLPLKCITGATIQGACRQVNADYAVCDGIIVRYACVAPAPKP